MAPTSSRTAASSVGGSAPPGSRATRASSCRNSGLPAASRARRSRWAASATWPTSSSDASWGRGERETSWLPAAARVAWRRRGAGSIGRSANASRWGARAGRRSRCRTSSIDASSAQCRSSRMSATGRSRASISSRLRSARWERKRSPGPWGAGAGPVAEAAEGSAAARSAPTDSMRRGCRVATWSSSASTTRPNGTSRSCSAARPSRTRRPAVAGPILERGQQRALADAGLTEDGEHAALAAGRRRRSLRRRRRARARGRRGVPARRSCPRLRAGRCVGEQRLDGRDQSEPAGEVGVGAVG